jgi:two-component system nitrate/nitrite response regulator NarL
MHQFVQTVVVDESDLFREGLMRILSGTRFRVIADYPRLSDLPNDIASIDKESLMLLGIDADPRTILGGLPSIKARYEHLRVVMLSEQFNLEQLLAAIELGADGYLLKKRVSPDALLKSMDLVFLGESILPQTFMQFVRSRLRSQIEIAAASSCTESPIQTLHAHCMTEVVDVDGTLRFSVRERAILEHLTHGASNKAIARELHLAEATVKVHVKAILRKIRVQNRTQAAIWAIINILPAISP